MLEGIDQVPWRKLRHLRGRATDVPQILRDLVSDDEDVVMEAVCDGLWDKLCHQYTLYEASPYVIPFLIEMLRDGHLDGRSARRDALQYLEVCAYRAHRPKPLLPIPVLSWLLSLLPSHEPNYDMRAALLQGKETYRRFAQDPNLLTRWTANQLLGWCEAAPGKYEWKEFDYKGNAGKF